MTTVNQAFSSAYKQYQTAVKQMGIQHNKERILSFDKILPSIKLEACFKPSNSIIYQLDNTAP
jgi:hypothetical protein